jgi:hypothetical protein
VTLHHVVLFRFAGEDEARQCVARLRGMDGRIPVVRRLEAGLNQVPSERAYDVGLVVTVDSLDDLRAYAEHPVHRPVLAWVRDHATAVAAADFDADAPVDATAPR